MTARAQIERESSLAARYEALIRVSQAVSAHRDPKQLFHALAGELCQVVQFDGIGVVQFDDAGNKIKWHLAEKCSESGTMSTTQVGPEDQMVWWAYENQQPVVVSSVLEETRFPRTMEMLKGFGILSGCVLPLTTAHRRMGCLFIGSEQVRAYADDEISFLSLVANQVAVAMDDALNFEASERAHAELHREKDRLKLLLDVNNSVVSNLELRELLRAVAASVRQVMHCDVVGVDLPDADGKNLLVYALDFPEGKGLFREEVLLPIDGTPPGQVFRTGKPVLLDHPAPSEIDAENYRRIAGEGIQYGCMLPLISRERVLGVFGLGRREGQAFTQEDVDFLMQIANQVAIAVENALAYTQTTKLKEKLGTLLQVSEAIALNRDLKELFNELAGRLPRIFQFDFMNLVLHDAAANVMRLELLIAPEWSTIKPGLVVPVDDSPAGMAWKTQQPVVIANVDEETRFPLLMPLLRENRVQSCCMVPLTSGERRLGSMGFGSFQKRTYSQAEVGFMRQVANQVAIAVDNALAYGQIAELQEKLAQEKLYLEDEIRSELRFEEIVGKSVSLRRMLREVETVAPSDSTVLILGETGTGKELIARAIHTRSTRQTHPFVKLNCAAIPTGLLESELFGHERGAFTGAIAQRIGRFELATRGTVFLDEIAEIPLELQPKLLRVLQEREFERLGSTRTLRSDARLIAATNRELETMVNDQKFREDLFYRLNVFPVRVPPLRERREDIPILVRHFAEQFARRMKKEIETIPSETMTTLTRYHWPGNVRELQNIIERAVIVSSGPVLNVALSELRQRVTREPVAANASKGGNGDAAKRGNLENVERNHILSVLQDTNWVLAGPDGAAERLGLKRSTLQFRMKKLGIARPAKRAEA